MLGYTFSDMATNRSPHGPVGQQVNVNAGGPPDPGRRRRMMQGAPSSGCCSSACSCCSPSCAASGLGNGKCRGGDATAEEAAGGNSPGHDQDAGRNFGYRWGALPGDGARRERAQASPLGPRRTCRRARAGAAGAASRRRACDASYRPPPARGPDARRPLPPFPPRPGDDAYPGVHREAVDARLPDGDRRRPAQRRWWSPLRCAHIPDRRPSGDGTAGFAGASRCRAPDRRWRGGW